MAVGLLWALGCLNIGSLLFARTISRRAEMAVRISIGAGRARLFGQMLAENAVLAFCGCVASVFVTLWGHRLVTSIIPWKVFAGAELELNARVALLITLSFVLTALLISAMSLWALPEQNIADILKSGGGSVIGSFKLRRVMNGVVVCEIALAVVLLACAGLMVRSFWALRYRDLGFRPERILTLRVDLAPSTYTGRARQAAFFEELGRRVNALPGVESVGLCSSAPPTPVGGMFRLTAQGQPAASALPLMARVQVVNSDFFRVLRVPFVEGRAFAERAQAGDAPEVVVNRTLRDEYLTEGAAVGRKIRLGGPKSPWVTVVGVAEDFKNVGLGDAPEPEVYYPYQQFPSVEAMYLLVRSSSVEPSSLTSSVRREVWAIDREQPLAEVQTLDQRLTSSVAHPRFVMALLVGF
ncbi:MAG TPA: ABC transporter permease, partial [Pyrinomonadaceae bacterium]